MQDKEYANQMIKDLGFSPLITTAEIPTWLDNLIHRLYLAGYRKL